MQSLEEYFNILKITSDEQTTYAIRFIYDGLEKGPDMTILKYDVPELKQLYEQGYRAVKCNSTKIPLLTTQPLKE